MEDDLIQLSLNELRRLIQINPQLRNLIKPHLTSHEQDIKRSHIVSKSFSEALKVEGVEINSLLVQYEEDKIALDFYEFLFVHCLLPESGIIKNIQDLSYLISQNEYFKRQINRESRSKFIIYLEFFNVKLWREFLQHASLKEWEDVELLGDSIPYCEMNVTDICDFLKRATINHPSDHRFHNITNKVLRKIDENDFKEDVLNKSLEIVRDEYLLKYLHCFLKGSINTDVTVYNEFFERISPEINKQNASHILWTFSVVYPGEIPCDSDYFKELDRRKQDGMLSITDYLIICGNKKNTQPQVLDSLRTLITSEPDIFELQTIAGYLINNVDQCEAEWYRDVGTQLFNLANPGIMESLNYLLEKLAKQNLNTAYEFLSNRFENLGQEFFLEQGIIDLISLEEDIFAEKLTHWFLSDNTNVHLALFKLSSVLRLQPFLRLSEKALKKSSASEKLFIAYKIAGFVFSKEPLQRLMFTLVEVTNPVDKKLLEGLFDLFDSYIIYNYRSTLELIKNKLNGMKMRKHVREFYNDLSQKYEDYFQNLSTVQHHQELEVDSILLKNIEFYEQLKFNRIHKEGMKGNSLTDLFRDVTVHSKKWALRRSNEKVHQVSSLGNFQFSTEFPSGERLSPIYQERLRKSYQKITKDEININ